MRVPHEPQNVGCTAANPVLSPQCGQKCRARSIARVQFGQGAVLSDRLPVGVDALTVRPASVEPGRSWNANLRPVAGTSPVAESAGRRRQPQWAQKLWCESRSLVRPQLAHRATGFVLARKSSGKRRSGTSLRIVAKLAQTTLRSNPLHAHTGESALSILDCRKFAATTTLRPCREAWPGEPSQY